MISCFFEKIVISLLKILNLKEEKYDYESVYQGEYYEINSRDA